MPASVAWRQIGGSCVTGFENGACGARELKNPAGPALVAVE
jgi:hypothetical protein